MKKGYSEDEIAWRHGTGKRLKTLLRGSAPRPEMNLQYPDAG